MARVSLRGLRFDNRSLRELPMDASKADSRRQVPNACFSSVDPTPVKDPVVVAVSLSVCKDVLEVDPTSLTDDASTTARILSGSELWPGSQTAAHCYCGHQFGMFAGQLGDGATMYVGEIINSKNQRWEIQYKGAGLTPYSRTADGRKVLRSSIREFLCSEHMFGLKIPTTRALSVTSSNSTVIRDILYDGHPTRERCAVVVRVAESFLRFGSFEIARSQDQMSGGLGPSWKHPEIVVTLLDYVKKHFYPEAKTTEDFILDVTKRTARLIAGWQTMGWTHGVMNTDNMSILGLTLDYGPYGFMERYNRHFVPNRSDDQGRYAYDQQPTIGLWNLLKLIETFDLCDKALGGQPQRRALSTSPKELALKVRTEYLKEYLVHFRASMRRKLGLADPSSEAIEKEQDDLYQLLFETMQKTAADFTRTFRLLSKCALRNPDEDFSVLKPSLGDVDALLATHKPRYEPAQISMLVELIDKGRAQDVLEATGLDEAAIRREAETPARYEQVRRWTDLDKANADAEVWKSWLIKYHGFAPSANRVEIMNAANPRFVLRNHVAQRAIVRAESGDFTEVNRVLEMCLNPFDDDDAKYIDGKDGFRYDQPSTNPEDEKVCAVSCSS